jgi:hypothetical protein
MRLPNEQEHEAIRNFSVAARQLAMAMIPPMRRLSEALTQFGASYRGYFEPLSVGERKPQQKKLVSPL